jgi:uncharacterized protein YktB (UPF0637 family)
MARLGFSAADFEVFRVEGFSERMAEIYAKVRPKLVKLGDELAPEIGRKLHLEFFPHVAKHARKTAKPPPETWAAFGQSPRGYKRYAYLALCISSGGIHARMVVKSEADNREQMARALKKRGAALTEAFKGTRVARYEKWDFKGLPESMPAGSKLWTELAKSVEKKTGGIDVGFGWRLSDALRLDRGELLDAYRELEPLYRVCTAHERD